MSNRMQPRGPIPPTPREVWNLAGFLRSRLAEDLGPPPYGPKVSRLYDAAFGAVSRLAPAAEALVRDELNPAWTLPWDALVEMAAPWAGHRDYKASFALRSDGTRADTGTP